MNEEDITFEALSGEPQLSPSDAPGAVESVTPSETGVEAMSLAELNKHLNKNFPTKEAALKSISDTFSYVGKKREDIEKEVLAKAQNNEQVGVLAKQLERMEKDRFFDKNPDLAPFREAYEKVGGSPDEFFNSSAFKPIIEKARGYDESQKLRTVLESNPRIASSKDNLSKARELQRTQGHSEAVEKLAVDAVLDVYSK